MAVAGGRTAATTRTRRRHQPVGYDYVHSAIDAYSRIAYSEILNAEDTACCTGFFERAHGWFALHGVTIERVLTDNGNGYRSYAWRDLCAELGNRPHPNPALPTANQRQGRTVQPDPQRRVGLRPRLPPQTATATEHLTAGSTATTITAATPLSEANHP